MNDTGPGLCFPPLSFPINSAYWGRRRPRTLLYITEKVQNGDYSWVSSVNAKYCFFPPLSLYTQRILTGLEHKNGEIKPKSRRRWGLVSRLAKDPDSWADLDDSDFSPSFTRIDLKNKKRQSDETLCRQVWAPVCARTAPGVCEVIFTSDEPPSSC